MRALRPQAPTDLYFRWEKQVCRRLDGPPETLGGLAFIPVEIVGTGFRDYVRMDLLEVMNEMEVIAWVSRSH